MKNKLKGLIVLLFLCLVQKTSAQSLLRFGPSMLLNFSAFDERVYSTFGGSLAYEFKLSEKRSLSISGMIHYGTHENFFVNDLVEKDLLIGMQVEYRFHLKELYEGVYWGIGADVKHLTAKNFFPPVPGDPEPTLVNWEVNLGVSLGRNVSVQNLTFIDVISPFVYLGLNPTDLNEYPVSCQIGFTLGF